MDKTVRLKISAQQKAVLKKYHDEGMISTRREMGSTIMDVLLKFHFQRSKSRYKKKKNSNSMLPE